VTFGVFTLWTGIAGEDSFAVQLDVKRGVFAALFRKPILDERLEPVCRVVDDALTSVPQVKELRWLTDTEFEQSYCRGRPLPPTAQDARPGSAGG
jgi:hypothetical protein